MLKKYLFKNLNKSALNITIDACKKLIYSTNFNQQHI